MARGFVEFLASAIGTPDDAIRLLLSLLAGYPLSFLYRAYVYHQSALIKHGFFIAIGLAIAYFNFGFDMYHCLLNIVIIYILLLISPGTKLSVGLAFFINTMYLTLGYISHSTDSYDFKWTMPHCVLTLRLTGVVFDVYDGKKKTGISQEQKETALSRVPSLIEMLGHSLCYGGFMIGPQFSMKRYLDFINGNFSNPTTGKPPDSIYAGLKRFSLGVLYIIIYQVLNYFVSDDFILSSNFQTMGLFLQCAYVLVWGKNLLNKYIGSWLLVEGSITILGLSYNGKDKNGNELWDGCANVRTPEFEYANTFRLLIHCFNYNTNQWMAKYVFKRLKFLGNKSLSQGVTLLYLAFWHGLHTGYYHCFLLEFMMTNFEDGLSSVLSSFEIVKTFQSKESFKPVIWLFRKLAVTLAMSYALVSFGLLITQRWLQVYKSMYFILHFVFLLWPVVHYILRKYVLPRKSSKTVPSNNTSNTESVEKKNE
ncbi:lysophospholipid acyltransferase 5 [Patella vulgata]|uniref:lysophospholipid acyltransferase 5 n=1 Tax=Patella vulgata TaxID=6465 RepID=UPI00218058DE|nr:lysophospholipid acyltransferase 5 [Patella vulgata]